MGHIVKGTGLCGLKDRLGHSKYCFMGQVRRKGMEPVGLCGLAFLNLSSRWYWMGVFFLVESRFQSNAVPDYQVGWPASPLLPVLFVFCLFGDDRYQKVMDST